MKYQLKNDNYKNFEVYKDNVLQPRSYFIPFDNAKQLAETDIRTERYASSMVAVLSGEWEFLYYPAVSAMPEELDTDSVSFDKVPVPSCWQYTGYEAPYYLNTRYQFTPNPPAIPEDCAVGVYRRLFDLDSVNGHYTLTFLGVAGALDVFVNGAYVGYSEGSHNTSEFEITELLTEGVNELIVVNHKFSNGTYLEAQDMFRSNGIFRDVLLTNTGENSIYDFEVQTEIQPDGRYRLTVLPSLKLTDECELTANLLFDGELIASASVNVSAEAIDKLEFSPLEVKEWSAETPHLYTLLLSLAKEGKPLEIIRRPIGFRHISINGNVFTFNHQPIKLLGVNHHDTDAEKGYVMTVEEMERDVRIFKEYNVNCVRTSHYPPDPIFLDLCDEYGIYVVDEADIEAHGCQTELHKPGACSHNIAWQPRYWDRVYRMFERDKNHPSITMWSLGNESWGYRNQDYCYEELKKRSDIPIHYENVVRTKRFAYDVISQMYPWTNKYHKLAAGKGLAKKWYEKPYFLCEYAHAMGLGAGELETYVSDFLRADNLMGGCIWEFADHAVYHENGKYRYTYGGDHGEEKHDGNFCVDGLFFPDRTPHAGALQMKNCYRPVRAAELTEKEFEFTNLNYFKDVAFTVKWVSYNRLGKLSEGSFDLALPPRGTTTVTLDTGEWAETVLFRYYEGERELASEQLTFGDFRHLIEPKALPAAAPTVAVSEKKRIIRYDGGRIVFNTATGEVESYTKNGREYINTAPFGNFTGFGAGVYRAPIDNDMYLKKVWKRYRPETEQLVLVKSEVRTEEKAVVIENRFKIATTKTGKLVGFTMTYHILGDGTVNVAAKCTSSKLILYAPRFGLTLEMPRQYDNVRYFGLGERQNLPDFREHAVLGEYSCKVDEMREKYIKPQESAMRSEVQWAEVTDGEGHGLRFSSTDGDGMIFSADHFTSQQCAKAMHQEDLKLCDTTFLHLDAYQLGAGSGACGPVPTKDFRRNSLKGEEISVTVEPI